MPTGVNQIMEFKPLIKPYPGRWMLLMTLCFTLDSLLPQLLTAEEKRGYPQTLTYPDIQVLGLFENKAFLRIDGEEVMLREGQSTSQGVTVNRVSSEAVEIQFWDDVRQYSVNNRIYAGYREPDSASAQIAVNDSGQYIARGSVNDLPASFLVDTGASILLLSERTAGTLSLKFNKGPLTYVDTASGTVKGYGVILEKVQVGSIVLSDIEATVIPGEAPANILLGMSFLDKVEIRKSNELMTLLLKN